MSNELTTNTDFQMFLTVLEQAIPDPRSQEIVARHLQRFVAQVAAVVQEIAAERDAALDELGKIEDALADASYTDHPLVEQMWQDGIEEGFEAGQEHAMDTWYESGGARETVLELLEDELRSVLAYDDYSDLPRKLAAAMLDHRILMNDLLAQELLTELLAKAKGES